MELPDDFAPRRLRRRALEVVALLAALVAVIVFAPGLGEVRHRFRGAEPGWIGAGVALDRKSTRLNSSHSQSSYAGFCLKKKKSVPFASSPCPPIPALRCIAHAARAAGRHD